MRRMWIPGSKRTSVHCETRLAGRISTPNTNAGAALTMDEAIEIALLVLELAEAGSAG